MKSSITVHQLFLGAVTTIFTWLCFFEFYQFHVQALSFRRTPLFPFELYLVVLLVMSLIALLWIRSVSEVIESPVLNFGDMAPATVVLWALAAILIVQRSVQFEHFKPWMDEIGQMNRARGFWPVEAGTLEHQPPLGEIISSSAYYLFGYSPFTLRIASMLASTFAVLGLYLLILEVTGQITCSSLAALALNFDPVFNTYSVEGRPISQGMLGLVIFLYFWRHWLSHMNLKMGVLIALLVMALLLALGGQPAFLLCSFFLVQTPLVWWSRGLRSALIGVLPALVGLCLSLPIIYADIKLSPPRFGRAMEDGWTTYLDSFSWWNLKTVLYPTQLWPFAIVLTLASVWFFLRRKGESTTFPLMLILSWWLFPLLYMPFFRAYIEWPWFLVKYYSLAAIPFWVGVGVIAALSLREIKSHWRILTGAFMIMTVVTGLAVTGNLRLTLQYGDWGTFYQRAQPVAQRLKHSLDRSDWLIPLAKDRVIRIDELKAQFSVLDPRMDLENGWLRSVYLGNKPSGITLVIARVQAPWLSPLSEYWKFPIKEIIDYPAFRILQWDLDADADLTRLSSFLNFFTGEITNGNDSAVESMLHRMLEYQAAIKWYQGRPAEAESLIQKAEIKGDPRRKTIVDSVYVQSFPRIFRR